MAIWFGISTESPLFRTLRFHARCDHILHPKNLSTDFGYRLVVQSKRSTKCRCKYLALLWKHQIGYPNFMLPSPLLIPWWLEGSKQYQSNPPTLRVLLHHFAHLFWLWQFVFELWSKMVCAMLVWSILKATSVASCRQTLWFSLIDRLNCFLGLVNATNFASLSKLLYSHRPVTNNHFMCKMVCFYKM